MSREARPTRGFACAGRGGSELTASEQLRAEQVQPAGSPPVGAVSGFQWESTAAPLPSPGPAPQLHLLDLDFREATPLARVPLCALRPITLLLKANTRYSSSCSLPRECHSQLRHSPDPKELTSRYACDTSIHPALSFCPTTIPYHEHEFKSYSLAWYMVLRPHLVNKGTKKLRVQVLLAVTWKINGRARDLN